MQKGTDLEVKGAALGVKETGLGAKRRRMEPRGVAALKPRVGIPEEQKKSAVLRQKRSFEAKSAIWRRKSTVLGKKAPF